VSSERTEIKRWGVKTLKSNRHKKVVVFDWLKLGVCHRKVKLESLPNAEMLVGSNPIAPEPQAYDTESQTVNLREWNPVTLQMVRHFTRGALFLKVKLEL